MVIKKTRSIDELVPNDYAKHPVWELVHERSEAPETAVRAVQRLPVNDLQARIVGLKVTLANGDDVWARLSNVDLVRPELNEHFLSISVEHNGKWCHLARYHDPGRSRFGPERLAAFLELPVTKVFPIIFDLSTIAVGAKGALRGVIRAEPLTRLSRQELVKLALG
jgi:hypothetical protein